MTTPLRVKWVAARRCTALLRAAGPLIASVLVALPAAAQNAAGGAAALPIYTCVDAAGKRLTSDRPIPECYGREQRLLNRDGSVRGVVAPAMTSDEKSAFESREREVSAERIHRQEAVRRDRNLLTRFPNEAAHRKVREAALEDSRGSLRESEGRLAALRVERKPLEDEAEFYAGKPLPLKLRLALGANDASIDAQKSLIANQQAEVGRIDKLYDAELERLRRLWAGAAPGSLGLVASTTTPPTSAASAPALPRRR